MAEIRTARFAGAFVDYGGAVFNVKHPEFGAVGDGVTDDTAAIQAAIDAAAGKVPVFVPDGTYRLTSPLLAPSQTHLVLAPGAVMRRGANTGHMVGNEPGEALGFAGGSGVVVEGGVWDANGQVYTDPMSIFAFAHLDGVTIKDAVLDNVDNYHHAEFAGCRGVRILNTTVTNFTGSPQDMVQLDQCRNDTSFPYFPIEYDNTPCVDVLIQGCTFRGSTGRAIVSHFTGLAAGNRDVRIVGNHFEDFSGSTAVVLPGVSGVIIAENTFEDCERGVTIIDEVSVGSGTAAPREVFRVSGNTFKNLGSAAASHAIRVESSQTNPNQQRAGTIADNVINGSERHGIVLLWVSGWRVSGNVIRDVGDHDGVGCGIILDAAHDCVVVGNSVTKASQAGIRLTRSTRNVVSGNKVFANDRDGIRLDNAAHDNLVHGNSVTENSQQAADTYDGVLLTDNCDRCSVKSNLVRGSASHRYGINVAAATCEFTVVTDNDLLGAGDTGALNDDGTGTVTASGNRT